MFFKKYRQRKEIERLSLRGIFYYSIGETTIKIDPLLAYIRLKERGLDVMSEDIRGALKGDQRKLLVFSENVREAFNVSEYDAWTGYGLTHLDCIRVYLAFYRYLEALKKNVILLRDFAPGLEQRLQEIYEMPGEPSDLQETNSSLDSTLTPPTLSPSPDSQVSSEQAEPSTV